MNHHSLPRTVIFKGVVGVGFVEMILELLEGGGVSHHCIWQCQVEGIAIQKPSVWSIPG